MRELAQILRDLFGSISNIEHCAENILLGVSQVNPQVYDEVNEHLKPIKLGDVRRQFSDTNGMPDDIVRVINILVPRMFLYHPLDKGNDTWDNRDSLMAKLEKLPGITDPKSIFQSVRIRDRFHSLSL